MSEQPVAAADPFLPPDFTGTVASPVITDERGKAIRHVLEYVRGTCTASYDVRVRRPR